MYTYVPIHPFTHSWCDCKHSHASATPKKKDYLPCRMGVYFKHEKRENKKETPSLDPGRVVKFPLEHTSRASLVRELPNPFFLSFSISNLLIDNLLLDHTST